jgi:DNA ligase (NAD+)
LLFALGIRHVGEKAGKVLAEQFADMETLRQAGAEQLTAIDDIGAIIAESVVSYFANPLNLALIRRLAEAGVNMRGEHKTTVDSALSGKTVVISGTLPNIGREEAKEIIEQAGGKVSGSVSKKTDYLLLGENPGSKLEKAQSLGVAVIDWPDMLALLEAGHANA